MQPCKPLVLRVVLLLLFTIVALEHSCHQEEGNKRYETKANLTDGYTSLDAKLAERTLACNLQEIE